MHSDVSSSDKKITWVCALALIGVGCLEAEADLDIGAREKGVLSTAECPGTRRVGFWTGAGSCPAQTAVWRGGRMFNATLPAEPELARYCLYDWAGAGAPNPLSVPGGAAWTEPDCQVLVPYGHPHEEDAAPILDASFHTQLQALVRLPVASPSPSPSRVLIVDSAIDQPLPDPSTGFLEHGRVMGVIARELGCPDPNGACLVAVSNQLALPLIQENGAVVRDETHGGKFGTLSDLARAIYDGFRILDGPGQDRVLINISVGWPPEFGGSFTFDNWQTLSPPVRAVYSVLNWVSCRGGLIVAAAGNNPGGTSLPGAAYPAMWELKPAPNAARCATLANSFPGPSTSTYRPLVFASTGVDQRDFVLATTRAGGIAQLVAPAAHTALDDNGSYTGTYVGSSLAAANTTAIAGVVWAYLGASASPYDVMELLTNSGVALPGVTPDFCLSGQVCRTQARRLSLCRAVQSACAQTGTCGPPVFCPLSPAGRDARPVGMDFSTPVPTDSSDGRALVSTTNPSPVERNITVYDSPGTHPFPPDPLCPVCILKTNGTLILGISNPDGYDLSEPTLRGIIDGQKKTIPLATVDQNKIDEDGAVIEVTDLPFAPSSVTSLAIEFVINDDYAHADQLMIEKP